MAEAEIDTPPELGDAASEAALEQALSEALMTELVKLRKKRKIGQGGIAEAIGMTQSRVSQIENLKRNVHLETVLVYARAIGCKIVVEDEAPAQTPKRRDAP